MSEFKNLDTLADQLFRDGMEKAHKESERIIGEAQSKAAEQLAKAATEAEEITSKAKKEADKYRISIQSEIQQKAKQAKQDLKTEVENLIKAQILSHPLKEVLSDQEFVKNLIISALEAWKDAKDLELFIPEFLKDVETDLNLKVQKRLSGLKVTPSSHLVSGFQIENKEKGYVLSFTESDFKAFFEPYLTDAVRNILFRQSE